ncbi:MAG: response regulator, partial [Caldimonas sp.]
MAKVLVVDDHASNRELIVTLLKHAGHESIEAADGYAALELVRTGHPDLVVCDILMPTMDGFEFVRSVRADPAIAGTRVIFCTATFLEEEARRLAQSCGVSQVLLKPCEPEDVLRAISTTLSDATAPELPNDDVVFDREHQRLLADKLVEKVEQLERANRRLSALNELNVQLASERDPQALLDKVCRGARDILGARFAVLGVEEAGHAAPTPVTTSGITDADSWRMKQSCTDARLPRAVMLEHAPRRFDNPGGDPLAIGLSGDYPPVHSGLIVPIASLTRVHGWILLIDKLGAEGFSEEDERLLSSLAAQTGRIHENHSLYQEMWRNAERLRESELRFRQLAENIREVFWLTDPAKRKILYVSPAYEEIWGRTCESVYASPREWIEAIHPDDRERVLEAAENDQVSGRYDEEFRIVRPDGSTRWIRDRAFPVFRNGTEVYRITGIAEDITARRRAAQELRESQRQLSDMLANVEMVSMMLDRSARITYCNDYLLRLTGWRPEDIIGKDWMELFIPPETELRSVFATLLDNDPRAWHQENEILTRSGERRLIRWHNSVRRSADGEVVGTASIGEDITEKKLAEREILSLNANLEQRVADRTADLERARAEANQANQAKSSFLAAMSHEIRTPMNGVIGMLDVLQQTNLRANQVEMVDLVRDSAASLLEIIEDILDFSKIEAGKLTVEDEPMRLAEVVEKACGMLGHMAAKKGVLLTLFVDPAIPASMLGDQTRLRQVLVNLIGNAIKFSSGREQPGQVSLRALLVARAPGVAAVDLVVADNGIGIDEATLARLFTPYAQADASTTRRFGGTGLGLTISDRLVRLMNGSMSVRSVPGQGSTFSVRFRFQTVAAAGDDYDDPSALVQGLHCRIVGPEQPLGDDLAAYLAHAGAIVERSADLASAASASASGELQIWVLLPSQRIGSAAELRPFAGGHPAVRFVMLEPGSTHRPRVVAPDIVAMAPGPLFRRTLFKAVALAASPAAGESRPEEPEPAKPAEPASGLDEAAPRGRLILVAEDNETNRKVILRQLQIIGFAAEVCVDGREALERWRGGDFAMLLTDLNMPELDGRALARAIRDEEPEGRRKPIIALTANTLREEDLGLRAAGFDGYLCKPVRLAQLRTSIEAWLGPAQPAATPRARPAAEPPAVNLDVLSGLVGNDAAVIEEVLTAFRESATLSGTEMTQSIAAGAAAATSDAAHKLKSAARAIGALRLGDLCERIEELAQARKAGELKALLPLFEAEWA